MPRRSREEKGGGRGRSLQTANELPDALHSPLDLLLAAGERDSDVVVPTPAEILAGNERHVLNEHYARVRRALADLLADLAQIAIERGVRFLGNGERRRTGQRHACDADGLAFRREGAEGSQVAGLERFLGGLKVALGGSQLARSLPIVAARAKRTT